MAQTIIELNSSEGTRPCSHALLERSSEIAPRIEWIYDLAGARGDDRFVFTSSGAEAINQVLLSVFLEVARKTGKCHFIASTLEDAPTMQMLQRLEGLGCFAKIAPVNETGQIDVDRLAGMIGEKTALISVSMAQGLTGVIQPVEEIAQLAKARGVLLHLDGAYAVGKYHFSYPELGADYLTFSGDLIHAGAGTGGLLAKKEAPLVPLILGGKGWRGGSVDVASQLSLCAACQQCSFFLDNMSLEVARLRDLFERELMQQIPGVKVPFQEVLRLPQVSAMIFPRVHQDALRYLLQRKVRVSVGGDYSQHLKALLAASAVPDGECALSFGLTRMTTEAEIRSAVEEIVRAVGALQSVSRGVFDAV